MSIKESISFDYLWKGTLNSSLYVVYQDDVCMCYNDHQERIATCSREELITFIKDLKADHYAN